MKSFIVLAFFVAAASASVGLGGSYIGSIGLAPIGSAQVITNVKTIQPVVRNVITSVVTPVVRNVVTPVISRVVSPVVVNTPVVRSIPVHAPVLSSRLITPIGLSGHGGVGGYGGLSHYGALSSWKE